VPIVLIVDDDLDIRREVSEILREEGFDGRLGASRRERGGNEDRAERQ